MSTRRTTVALHRCSYAISVLALMPSATVQTITDYSDFRVAMLAVSAAWTTAMGALYRRAVTKWIGDDDGS